MEVGSRHTVRAFDDDIKRLRGLISEMGGRAEQAIKNAMVALRDNNLELAKQTVADDKRIDALEDEIERLALQIIALRAPMADDLREVSTAFKMAAVLERIGDYAKNIAKRVRKLQDSQTREVILPLTTMGETATGMVRDALDSHVTLSAELAHSVITRDDIVDNFYDSIFRTLVTFMMENPRTISDSTHLLFVAKHIERIGDHATNIAEMVYYVVTGKRIEENESDDAS